jgi:hypothetical protein
MKTSLSTQGLGGRSSIIVTGRAQLIDVDPVTPRVVHTDQITRAETTHYTLEVDQPSKKVSFDEADKFRMRTGGAFLQHRPKGNFIMATESGRHTDPATGKSYRTFAVSKPDAPRAGYLNEAPSVSTIVRHRPRDSLMYVGRRKGSHGRGLRVIN